MQRPTQQAMMQRPFLSTIYRSLHMKKAATPTSELATHNYWSLRLWCCPKSLDGSNIRAKWPKYVSDRASNESTAGGVGLPLGSWLSNGEINFTHTHDICVFDIVQEYGPPPSSRSFCQQSFHFSRNYNPPQLRTCLQAGRFFRNTGKTETFSVQVNRLLVWYSPNIW